MRAVDIIIKKRDKKELTREEIRFFVHGIATGRIPDYQIVCLGNGCSAEWHDPP